MRANDRLSALMKDSPPLLAPQVALSDTLLVVTLAGC